MYDDTSREEQEARKGNTVKEPMAEKKNKKYFKSNENQKNKDKKFKFACNNCGKIGHKANDCWSKSRSQLKYVNKNQETTRTANVALHVNEEVKYWCLDSGASSHMCSDKSKFSTIKMSSETLHLENNESTKFEDEGIVKIKIQTGYTQNLEDALYVPDLRSSDI